MVMKANRPTDLIAITGTIDPDVTVASAVSSDWMSMVDFSMAMAVIMAGTLGSSATLDAKIEQATDASGTGVKDITGKAITQLTDGGTDSDKQAIIEVASEDLDVDNDFNHIRLTMTVGTATSDVAGLLIGMNARYGPASDYDLASVDEIIGLDA